MAARTPLVLGADGLPQQLQAADYLARAVYTDKQSLNGLATKTITVPAGYSTLRLVISGASSVNALQDNPVVTVNGLTTSIYSIQRQYVFNTTATNDSTLLAANWGALLAGLPGNGGGSGAPANSSGFNEIEIFDYANTTFYKTGRFHGRQPFATNSSAAYSMIGVLEARVTAAISSITVATTSGSNFANGSTVELILTP